MSPNLTNSFREFIEYEKAYSNEFLKQNQIYNERFDENDYKFIEFFFNEKIIINKIYSNIDEIIKILNLEYKFRFLVIADFFFSLSSCDLNDPCNLIFKISRNEYIKNIRLRAAINEIYNIDHEVYILFHKKLLIGLRLCNVIKKHQIRNFNKKTWETTIHFELNIKNIEDVFLRKWISIGYSVNPFIIINLNNSKYSVGSFRNIWKVKRKKREMEDKKIPYNSIVKANQIKLSLSSELFKINSKCIKDENNRLLAESNCSEVSEYFKKLVNILKDKEYIKNLLNEVEKIEDIEKENIWDLKKDIWKEYNTIMKNFQKILSISLVDEEILDKPLYLPCFIDNRGRQYYATLISPTFYKLFRNLYKFEEKKKFINYKNSLFYNKIMKYKNLVEEFKLDEINTYILLIFFIEIGKFFSKTEGKHFIETEEIIKNGKKNYEIKNTNLKFEDLLYVNKIYLNVNKLFMNEVDENLIIFKDATASGLQNYGLLRGYKEEALKYLNINGEDWYDTYQILVEKILIEKILIERKNWKTLTMTTNLLQRHYWKNTTMLIPYNATWYTCFINFIDTLKKENIEYKELSTEEQEYLKTIHRYYYDKVKSNLNEIFYKKEEKEQTIFKYNKWKEVNRKDYKVNFKKGRDKYTNILYMLEEDIKKTETAMEANNMHYLDSELVRDTMKYYEIIPIHDCFGIRLSELHLVMDQINSYYSKNIGKETYSIHIIK